MCNSVIEQYICLYVPPYAQCFSFPYNHYIYTESTFFLIHTYPFEKIASSTFYQNINSVSKVMLATCWVVKNSCFL